MAHKAIKTLLNNKKSKTDLNSFFMDDKIAACDGYAFFKAGSLADLNVNIVISGNIPTLPGKPKKP